MATITRKTRPAVPKVICGQKIEQAEFRRRIIDAIRSTGEVGADTEAIARFWGDANWLASEQRWLLSNTMANMERRGALRKLSRGRFVVDEERIKRKGLVLSDATERRALEFIEDRGGFAAFDEIITEFGAVGDSNLRKAIRNALANSVNIVESPEEFFRLTPQRLAVMPLMGKWLAFLFDEAWGKDVDAFDLAEEFSKIGLAYALAIKRRSLDHETILRSEGMAAFVQSYVRKSHTHYASMIYDQITLPYALVDGEIAKRLATQGFSDFEIMEERRKAREAFDRDFPGQLLLDFLDGDESAHKSAPLDFYWGLGDLLELDAAQLSRGLTQPVYTAEVNS